MSLGTKHLCADVCMNILNSIHSIQFHTAKDITTIDLRSTKFIFRCHRIRRNTMLSRHHKCKEWPKHVMQMREQHQTLSCTNSLHYAWTATMQIQQHFRIISCMLYLIFSKMYTAAGKSEGMHPTTWYFGRYSRKYLLNQDEIILSSFHRECVCTVDRYWSYWNPCRLSKAVNKIGHAVFSDQK